MKAENKHCVYRWFNIYPDDPDLIADNLSLEEAKELAKKLKKEDSRCNVGYVVE